MSIEGSRRAAIGIDAAIVADHQVTVRHIGSDGAADVMERFAVSSSLAGLERLTVRLADYAGSMVVCEPTSMTWLSLAVAAERAGCSLALVRTRDSARLRGALSGKHKSDVIDADMLSHAGELFGLEPLAMPDPAQLALRRVVQRRHRLVVDTNRVYRRMVALASWVMPDVWRVCATSRSASLALLRRWPHLEGLARARTSTIADVIAAATRGVADVERRAANIRDAARAWSAFWDGHLDLDAVAVEFAELLASYDHGRGGIVRAETEMVQRWEAAWGDDPVLRSVPGMGQVVAPTVRAFFGDGTCFPDAKSAQAYVGLAPSNWSSGTTTQPSRAITKEGPQELRLAFYLAANAARTVDPQLADFYRRLMVERGHCHTKATCAVARKLIGRTWATISRGVPYQMRDLDGTAITIRAGKDLARSLTVPDEIRRRRRAHTAATRRSRLAR